MARRFWHSNRDYCQLLYEKTGLLPDRVAYSTDVTQYYLYFHKKKWDEVEKRMPRIREIVASLEGAEAVWERKEGCLVLLFLE